MSITHFTTARPGDFQHVGQIFNVGVPTPEPAKEVVVEPIKVVAAIPEPVKIVPVIPEPVKVKEPVKAKVPEKTKAVPVPEGVICKEEEPKEQSHE